MHSWEMAVTKVLTRWALYAYGETDKSGAWMKQLLMHHYCVRLNTTFRECEHKHNIFRTATGKEKQLDHVLVHRRKHAVVQRC